MVSPTGFAPASPASSVFTSAGVLHCIGGTFEVTTPIRWRHKMVDRGGVEPAGRSYRQPYRFTYGWSFITLSLYPKNGRQVGSRTRNSALEEPHDFQFHHSPIIHF